MSAADIAKITGKRIIFCGVDTHDWTLGQFQAAAQWARAHHIDTLLIKTGEGTWLWYNGFAGWETIRRVILAEGVGAIPYFYSKGDSLGGLDGEIAIYKQYMQADGILCIDAEIEWDGHADWGQRLATALRPVPGMLLVSTWADPSWQNWGNVIRALAPATDVFMPQQYNDFLQTFWQEFAADGASFLIPTVNLDQSFGTNHPVTIAADAAAEKHPAISIWDYEVAVTVPDLIDQITAQFPEPTSSTPTPPEEEPVAKITINTPVVSHFFKEQNGAWLCPTKNTQIQGVILDTFVGFGNNELCGLTHWGLPITNEMVPKGIDTKKHPHTRWQRYERVDVAYDPDHALDNPPGAGAVYILRKDLAAKL